MKVYIICCVPAQILYWQKSCSWDIGQNTISQSDCRISPDQGNEIASFLPVDTNLQKLKVDWKFFGRACSKMGVSGLWTLKLTLSQEWTVNYVTIIQAFHQLIFWMLFLNIWDLVPFVEFKKREKYLWRSVTLLKPATLLKVTLFHGCFSHFLNCTNGTNLRNTSHLVLIARTLSCIITKKSKTTLQLLENQKS